MNGEKKTVFPLGKMIETLERYKFVLVVILVGAVLLLWPEEKGVVSLKTEAVAETASNAFDLAEVERKMSAALSEIDGTGSVTVVLTVKNSSRNILAEDKNLAAKEGSSERTAETVVISTGSGSQSPVLVEQVYPEFQGALVVCSGGDRVDVRLKLVEAVSALTGLGADKICICKGK